MENIVRKLAQDSLRSKNIVVDGDMMIGKKIAEVLGSEVDYTFCK